MHKANLAKVIDFAVKLALIEDIGEGDITTRTIIPADRVVKGEIRAKEAGIIAGLPVAKAVFLHLNRKIKFSVKIKEGAFVNNGTVLAVVSGPAREIVTGERVALNFLQHLSGIATLTRQFVSRCPKKTKILDTRKTTPGLRLLEKYAVRIGDGTNHRLGLYDAVLVKDNHIKIAGGIKLALAKVGNKNIGRRKIEVETKDLTEVREAINARADRILLDNMDLKTLKEAVNLCQRSGIKTEASGGVKLDNVEKIAQTGVDYISIGALTHSAKALDINLKIVS